MARHPLARGSGALENGRVSLRESRHLSGLGIFILWAGTLVSVLNASMSTVVLPDVQATFLVRDDDLAWFVAAYLIPFATGTVVYGRLADRYAASRLLLVGLVIFAAGSFAVAAAPTFLGAALARGLQGVGAPAIPALTLAIIARATDPRRQSQAVGAVILAVGLGFALGPLVGGGLADAAGWQGPFVATGTTVALLTGPAVRGLPDLPPPSRANFDVPGALLFLMVATAFLLAINRLPHDPEDGLGRAAAAASLPLAGLLVLRTVSRTDGFLSRRLFGNARFVGLAAAGFAAQGTHFATIVLLPLLLARYHRFSLFEVGFALLPGALLLGGTGVLSGRIVRRLGGGPTLIIGTWLLLISSAAFHGLATDWAPEGISALYALLAVGFALVNGALLHAVTEELPEELVGVGTGVFNLSFFLGGATTVALTGAVLEARSQSALPFDRFVSTRAPEFSDAFLVVLTAAAAAFLVALVLHLAAPLRERIRARAVAWTTFHGLQGKPNRPALRGPTGGRTKPNRRDRRR